MSARYEITLCDTRVEITDPWGCVLTIYDGAHEMTVGAIRQQSADIAALKDALADEVTANEAFRKAGGARDDEDMPAFCARLIAEAEIGRKWNANSALEEWFPLTADCIKRDALELADTRLLLRSVQTQLANADTVLAELFPAAEALREELAAVAGERDRYHYQALTLDMLAARTLGDEPAEDAIMEKMDNLPDSKNPSGHLIACVIAERDQLRARLAAIDAAPVAAWQWMDTGHFRKNKPDGATVFNWRPLYAAPPAPVSEIREVEVTDEMAERAYISKWRGVPELIDHEPDDEGRQWAREWLSAWRAELGPTLGLVELKEPTPEECGRIYSFWIGAEGCNGRTPGERMGRSMAIAYRAVMFPQESEVGL